MEEIDLKEIFTMFWSKRFQILYILLVAIMLGIIYTLNFVKPVYTSTTTLVLATSENSETSNSITTTDIILNSKLVSTYSELVKSNNILRQVIANLGLDIEEESLRKNINVSAVTDTELIKIDVTTEEPEDAALIANEIANVFTEKVTEIYNISNIHVMDTAKVSTTPSNVNHAKDIMIFTLTGIIVAIAYVILANMLDATIKSPAEVEKLFDVPVLASMPLHSFNTPKKEVKKNNEI